jgi:cell division protein FtsB
MEKNIKVVGGLSRKAKINIFVAIFILFILIAIFSSINQISSIIKKQENLIDLEGELNYSRNNNIKLFAEEKSLYNDQVIEQEARNQFNMTKGSETNFFVQIGNENAVVQSENGNNANVSSEIYSNSNLWENIKIFYDKELKK